MMTTIIIIMMKKTMNHAVSCKDGRGVGWDVGGGAVCVGVNMT